MTEPSEEHLGNVKECSRDHHSISAYLADRLAGFKITHSCSQISLLSQGFNRMVNVPKIKLNNGNEIPQIGCACFRTCEIRS